MNWMATTEARSRLISQAIAICLAASLGCTHPLANAGAAASPEARRAVEKLLEPADKKSHSDLIRAAASYGVAALQPTVDALANPNTLHRTRLVWLLAKIPDPSVESRLVALLQDSDVHVRVDALDCLRDWSTSKDADAIAALLAGKTPDEKQWALYVLRELGDKNHLDAVIGATKDPDESVRAEAANALACYRGEAALRALDALRNDPSKKVKARVFRSLCVLRPDDPKVIKAFDNWDKSFVTLKEPQQRSILKLLKGTPHPRLAHLLQIALRSPSKDVRMDAVGAVDCLPDETASQLLLFASKDKDKFLRFWARNKAASQRFKGVAESMRLLLHSNDRVDVLDGCEYFRNVSYPRAVEDLKRVELSQNPELALSAAVALSTYSVDPLPRVVEELHRRLTTSTPEDRSERVFALRGGKGKWIEDALELTSKDPDQSVREQVQFVRLLAVRPPRPTCPGMGGS